MRYKKRQTCFCDILFATIDMDLDHCHLSIQSSHATPPLQARKKRRRQGEQENGKTFVCHCGKVYMSYPGLYIHRKSKHGQKPNESVGYGELTALKKGPVDLLEEKAAEPISFNEEDRKTIEGPLSLDCLQKYLEKFVIEEELRQGNDVEIYRIAREMTNYWQVNCKEREPRACGLYTTPVTFVLGHFLRALQRAVDPKYHTFLSRTIVDFEAAVCEFYQNKDYTKIHSAHPLPLLMNQLAIMLINQAQDNISLEDKQKRRCIICLILLFLSRWIKAEGFTEINLKLNLA